MKPGLLYILILLTAMIPMGSQTASAGAKNEPSTLSPTTSHTATLVLPASLQFEKIAENINRPVAITHAGDGSGRLFITSQDGKIVILKGGQILVTPFLDISTLVVCCGEQGLLSVAFHPNYENNGYFYVNYTRAGDGATVIERFQISGNPDIANPNSGSIILVISQDFANHNGGQLQFGPDGYLYIGVGDGGSGGDPNNRAQDPNSLLGKMLRIDVDGGSPYAIPVNNPFVSDASVRDEIWSFGLRNPWRFSFDRLTGDLFIGDVGQANWEEINFQPADSSGGENYGWSCYEGSHVYNPSRNCTLKGVLTNPILEYDHGQGCSITGGYRYRGNQYPLLYGVYLYGDFCSGRMWGAIQNGATWATSLLADTTYLITTFGEDEDGEFYVADYSGKAIYHIAAPGSWVGSALITSDENVVAVGRPHINNQVMAYGGFASGAMTMYVPMLFRKAFGGSYNAALYVQNLDPAADANIAINYYDTSSNLTCTVNDTISVLASRGYWLPSVNCLTDGWMGGAVITSNRNIAAVGRPHIGNEILTYNGFASGSDSVYVPMLFRKAFGGAYNAALYVQNVEASPASVTINYYDTSGNLTCTINDNLPALSSHGYWTPQVACLTDGWVGAAVITANRNIVAVGRPHIGSQIMAYDGFAGGSFNAIVPMLHRKVNNGMYNAALYIQNLDPAQTTDVTLKYYDTNGSLTCTVNDSVPHLSSKGYWTPTVNCLPDGWEGQAVITANRNIVAIGRPHFGDEIFTYNGFTGGSANVKLPMLFKNAFGATYNSALWISNPSETNTAHLTVQFYETGGSLACTMNLSLAPLTSISHWLPDLQGCLP